MYPPPIGGAGPPARSRSAVAATADPDAIAGMVMAASRVLVGVAARSLSAAGNDITVPQFRALVILATRGPQQPVGLAEALGLTSSSVTRLCDRLIRKGLILREREDAGGDRRAVRLSVSEAGSRLVEEVTARRTAEIRDIVARVPAEERPPLVSAFQAFAAAASQTPDRGALER